MNRVKKVARLWLEQRPRALAVKAERQRRRNAQRQPKPKRNLYKL